ncbi:MAG: TIGR02117 family protein [Pirellula sp.]|jgi:uncharacterized protein (TIGR02117 family)|nr:TIGR02117 family protein [Pirellula sp.]
MNATDAVVSPKKSRWRKLLMSGGRIFLAGVLLVVLFVASSFVLARIPVNRSFQHAVDDGIDILLINNGVHVDLVIPLDEPSFRMRPLLERGNYKTDPDLYTHATIGWGNRNFYLETPTWSDIKLTNVLYAFTGLGETTVHVELTTGFLFGLKRERQRLLRLSHSQFRSLCEHIERTLKKDNRGSPLPIACEPYGDADCFFEGVGRYHLFRTCNVWVGEGLKQSGVRVGFWTVTPNSLFACLPEDAPRH